MKNKSISFLASGVSSLLGAALLVTATSASAITYTQGGAFDFSLDNLWAGAFEKVDGTVTSATLEWDITGNGQSWAVNCLEWQDCEGETHAELLIGGVWPNEIYAPNEYVDPAGPFQGVFDYASSTSFSFSNETNAEQRHDPWSMTITGSTTLLNPSFFEGTGPTSYLFAGVPHFFTDGSLHQGMYMDGNFAGSITLTLEGDFVPPAAVPVPAAVWLFGSGLLGLVGVAKRKVHS